MRADTYETLSIYARGFALLFGQVCVASLLGVWALQFLAALFGESYHWGHVLEHLILSLSLLVLYPGQTFWTFRLRGVDGHVHTIVGHPVDADDPAESADRDA